MGVIYSLVAPKASPLRLPPAHSAPPPPDTPFFQQLLALLLCSLHRCALLLCTPCPWTFPTRNFPNQSTAIKMSGREEENCGAYLKRKKNTIGRCFTHTVIPVDFLDKGPTLATASQNREEGGELKRISQNPTSKGPVPWRRWAQSLLSALGCPAVHAAGQGVCEWGQLQERSLYFTVYNTLTWRWPTLTSQLCRVPARRVGTWEALCQPLCAQLPGGGGQTPKNRLKTSMETSLGPHFPRVHWFDNTNCLGTQWRATYILRLSSEIQ